MKGRGGWNRNWGEFDFKKWILLCCYYGIIFYEQRGGI